MTRRPLILVTGPANGGYAAWFFTRLSIWIAGGKARRVHPENWKRISKDLRFDGLVLGGGADVDPSRYGETLLQSLNEEVKAIPKIRMAHVISLVKAVLLYILRFVLSRRPHSGFLDKARDDIELALLDRAIEENVPVLGICRGCQLINVYFRGNLYQSVKNFYHEYPQYRSVLPKKRVTIEEGSRLLEILGSREVTVNALHNQAVKTLSPALRIVAREKNGIVQAIEALHTAAPVLGVQWHPEYLFQKPEQRRLFQWLVREAAIKQGHVEQIGHASTFASNHS
jgi:putative glutamine amidotransferase